MLSRSSSGLLCFSPLLLAMGAVERAGGEIEEDNGHGGVDEEPLMARSGSPVGAQTEDTLNKEKAEDGEEEACDFEPENASGVNEGSPDGLAESFCSLFYSSDSAFAARGVDGRVLADGLGGLGGAVAQHSRCDARTYAQLSANATRFHKKSLAVTLTQFRLQAPGNGSKVKGVSSDVRCVAGQKWSRDS